MAYAARALSRATLLLARGSPVRKHLVPPQLALHRPFITQPRFFCQSPFNRAKREDDEKGLEKHKDEDEDDDYSSSAKEPYVFMPAPAEFSADDLSPDEKAVYDMMSLDERAELEAEYRSFVEHYNNPDTVEKMERDISQIERDVPEPPDVEKKAQLGFWAEDEDDEFAQVEDGNEGSDDVITSMAETELELHREMRHYARLAAWDMPLLAKHAKEFTLPPQTHILRFRYTYYMGEHHPAEHKVVMELCSKDLVPNHLTEDQRQTFLKLVGTRYNPDTDIIRMSTEKFDSRAQNKRYLGDLVESLINEAKNGDSFADVPLDLRHHKPKVRHYFPEAWKMTEARQKQLAATREQRKLAEAERESIVYGKEAISEAVKTNPTLSGSVQSGDDRRRVAVRVGNKSASLKQRR